MERELWPVLYHAVRDVGRGLQQKGVTYQPWVLALVVLWAAIHDRPRGWACVAKNWSTTTLRPLQLPSASVLSRRADTVGLGLFWRLLEVALRGTTAQGVLSLLDGKPLPIGGYSKDREARWGYAAGGFAKGYKLHAIWSNHCLPEAWDVVPMNVAEPAVAEQLLRQVAEGGYLLADGNYDTNPLHDSAGQRGYQLLAQDRRKNAGKGHRWQSPFRQRGLALRQTSFGRELLGQRAAIERAFGHATIFAGGLSPLPAWVRRQRRVRTWVWSKLFINATRILIHQSLAA